MEMDERKTSDNDMNGFKKLEEYLNNAKQNIEIAKEFVTNKFMNTTFEDEKIRWDLIREKLNITDELIKSIISKNRFLKIMSELESVETGLKLVVDLIEDEIIEIQSDDKKKALKILKNEMIKIEKRVEELQEMVKDSFKGKVITNVSLYKLHKLFVKLYNLLRDTWEFWVVISVILLLFFMPI
jgi:hypothetical protein